MSEEKTTPAVGDLGLGQVGFGTSELMPQSSLDQTPEHASPAAQTGETNASWLTSGTACPTLINYFYFPKDELQDIKDFCELIAADYDVMEKAVDSALSQMSGFGREEKLALYRLQRDDVFIEIYLIQLRQFICLAAFWFDRSEVLTAADVWKRNIIQLRALNDRLRTKNFMILGETRFFMIAGLKLQHEFDQAKALIDEREMLTSQIEGGTLYHFPERRLRTDRNYILKMNADEGIQKRSRLYFSHLPSLDFTIQRLNRLSNLYRDDVSSIMSEKKGIDKEINEILHQQVVVPQDDALKLALWEKEIGNLSKMYGKLASDGAKIRDAMTNTQNDLENLRRELEQITGKEHLGKDQIFHHYIEQYRDLHQELIGKETEVKLSVDRVKAAIDLVQTQVELFRGAENVVLQAQTKELLGQNIKLQEERMALQIAAGFVEFVIIFYYFLNVWAEIYGLHEFELLPWYIKFGVTMAFSGSVVSSTHFIAQMLQKKNWRSVGFWVSIILLLISVGLAIGAGSLTAPSAEH